MDYQKVMKQMSYLTDKFKGVYRIKVPCDLSTNDFPRKIKGGYEDIDCYIDCQNNNKVFHYGHNILMAYIPSIQRGHNIIKAINNIGENLIFNIEETDTEVIFYFKYSNSDKIIPLLKPKTLGNNISPFSTKNLPKTDYKIPDEDLLRYKSITANLPKELWYSTNVITQNFIKSLARKKSDYEDIKADMRQQGLKGKNYIHSIGKWDEYLKHLKVELDRKMIKEMYI